MKTHPRMNSNWSEQICGYCLVFIFDFYQRSYKICAGLWFWILRLNVVRSKITDHHPNLRKKENPHSLSKRVCVAHAGKSRVVDFRWRIPGRDFCKILIEQLHGRGGDAGMDRLSVDIRHFSSA